MRKVLCVMLAVTVCLFAAIGCSSDTNSDATTVGSSSDTDMTDWTKAEWDKASAEQKKEASELVVTEVGSAMGGDFGALIEQAKTDENAKAQIDEQISAMESTIDTFFEENPDSTLGECIDSSKALLEEVVAQMG